MLRKLKNNDKKLQAMKNFVFDINKNYKFYKSMKLKTSAFVLDGMNTFNNPLNREKSGEINDLKMDEIKEVESDNENEKGNQSIDGDEGKEEKDENLVEDNSLIVQNIEFTQSSLSERRKKKAKTNKKKRKKIQNTKIKIKIKRAKSK